MTFDRHRRLAAGFVAAALALGSLAASAEPAAGGTGLRLYVLDCGAIHVADTARYELRREEVETDLLSVPCYLVHHPRGLLVWDTGAVPDAEWQPTGRPLVHRLTLPDGQSRDITLTRSLGAQLHDIGVEPSAVRFLALSHYHYDHTANAGLFAGATWLVRRVEREAMFQPTPPGTTRPQTYAALRGAPVTLLERDEHDVFGDGSVMIKSAPGHTPGHQVLLVRLARTGAVLLSGDLYHFPQERTLGRFPVFEFDREQTRRSRADIDAYLQRTGAILWIQHDAIANDRLRKAPDYYD
ncbi:MAG: N-acyl homoserine lactonase family protein [Proteobacteria bacterium]|nr:N-acyl homoserine lactonase family protein [Pseudomonadota bacterium]